MLSSYTDFWDSVMDIHVGVFIVSIGLLFSWIVLYGIEFRNRWLTRVVNWIPVVVMAGMIAFFFLITALAINRLRHGIDKEVDIFFIILSNVFIGLLTFGIVIWCRRKP